MDNLDYEKMTDGELVTDYLAGQEEILPIIINRHLKPVYRFVFGLVLDESVAEDITQDVFIKVWKKIKSYNQEYNFKTWIFSIARNTVIDYWRKKKDIIFSKFDNAEGDNIILDTLADNSPDAYEAFAIAEEITDLKDILQELPPLYREVLVLRYISDLSIEEISVILKRPIETVKSQHRRGLMHLKELLLRKQEDK